MDGAAEKRGFTRGGVIKAGAVGALAVGAGGAAGAAIAGASRPNNANLDPLGIGKPGGGPAHLRRSTYEPLVGSEFRVHVPGEGPLKLKLVEARALRGPGDSFSLIFRGDRQVDVEGGLYRVEHRKLGAFDLFVNPVGRGVKGLNLEAVINRIAT